MKVDAESIAFYVLLKGWNWVLARIACLRKWRWYQRTDGLVFIVKGV